MSKNGMLAAVAKAAGKGEDEAIGFTLTPATLAQHFPDVAAAVKAEGHAEGHAKGFADGRAEGVTAGIEQGAAAEHARMTGIEEASMRGFEHVIAEHKADRSKTPADAALAVLKAQKAKMATLKGSLDNDEAKMAGLASTAGADGGKADRPPPGNVMAVAADISARADQYINQQKAAGKKAPTVAEAVAAVTKEG